MIEESNNDSSQNDNHNSGEDSSNDGGGQPPQQPDALFLHPDAYDLEQGLLFAPPSQGYTENYDPQYCFLTRSSSDQSTFFQGYGGTQVQYNRRVAETVLVMSRILLDSNGYLPDIVPAFERYLLGYDQDQNPYGIAAVTQIATENGVVDLRNVIWTFTETPCEYFFAYLAFHRHVIAFYAPSCKNREKFGKNRYRRHYDGDDQDTILHTDIRRDPYRPTWQTYLNRHKGKIIDRVLFCSFPPEKISCGSLTNGNVYNGCISRVGYITIYSRMNDLLTQLVVGQNLLPKREFLRAVFEIQYLFIHLMPYDRGSLAVMNVFRFVMLAYYNRRQPVPALRLPLAPTRTDAYPDLHALILCDNLEDFIEASFRDLYCVDYNLYCDD